MNIECYDSPETIKKKNDQELADLLDECASDEAFARYYADMRQQLDAIEGKTTFYMREEQIHHLRAQANGSDRLEDLDAIYDQKRRIEADLYSRAEYRKYASLTDRMDEIARANKYTVSANDPIAESLVRVLSDVSGVNRSDEHHPPFMHYKENTRDAWRYVPDQAVRDYLDALTFVDTSRMRLPGNVIAVHAEYGKDLAVPLSLFVDAAGFESWKGRPDDNNKSWSSSEYGNGGVRSVDTIKHYAALSTDLPSVTVVNVYIQPDGLIFANNGAGDSHRIGAAFLRGQQEITANTIHFVRLKENYVRLGCW